MFPNISDEINSEQFFKIISDMLTKRQQEIENQVTNDMKKYFYNTRVVNTWSELKQETVNAENKII